MVATTPKTQASLNKAAYLSEAALKSGQLLNTLHRLGNTAGWFGRKGAPNGRRMFLLLKGTLGTVGRSVQ